MAMAERRNQKGFALLLVLLVVAMAAVLGYSYLASSAIRNRSSAHLVRNVRARYLAESGLQHALFMMRSDPSQLAGRSADNALGPFYADDSEDSYRFYARSVGIDEYVLTAVGNSGSLQYQCSAKIYRSPARMCPINQGVTCTGDIIVPSCVNVQGDVYAHGEMRVFRPPSGNLMAEGSISGYALDSDRVFSNVLPRPRQELLPGFFRSYSLRGAGYSAVNADITSLSENDELAEGVVGANNPAGVLYVRPEFGNTVTINSNVKFNGTLVVEGNLLLNGSNIKFKAQDGFPSVVVSGFVLFRNNISAEFDGLVVAQLGMLRAESYVRGARTTMRGGIFSTYMPWVSVDGLHVVEQDLGRTRIYDFNPQSRNFYEVRVEAYQDGSQGPLSPE